MQCLFSFRMKKQTDILKHCNNVYKSFQNLCISVFTTQSNLHCCLRCMRLHVYVQALMQVSLCVQFIAHAKSQYFHFLFCYCYIFPIRLSIYFCFKVLNTLQNNMSRIFRIVLFICFCTQETFSLYDIIKIYLFVLYFKITLNFARLITVTV